MPDPQFDPYHKWLGIPPKDQPPNFYRLLSIELFEDDADVIEAAAQRQISHLRTYAIGPKSDLSQELLKEVVSARVTLLNPARKAEYDQELMQSHAPNKINQSRPQQPIKPPSNATPTQVHPPSFSDTVTLAQRTSLRNEKRTSSWKNPLLVSGLLVAAVVLSIPLLKALQQEPEVAQAPLSPTVETKQPSYSQGSQTTKPGVNQQLPVPSANIREERGLQPIESIRGQDFLPAIATPSVAPSTTDENGSTDLLALVDLDKHKVIGKWERVQNGVIGTGTFSPKQQAILQIPCYLPKSFSIEFDISRLSAFRNGFLIRVPVGRGSVGFFVDQNSNRIPYTGVESEGRNLVRIKGPLIDQNKPLTIRCEIAKDKVTLVTAGKERVSWAGDPTQLQSKNFSEVSRVPDPRSIYIAASHDASFLISRIQLFPTSEPERQSTALNDTQTLPSEPEPESESESESGKAKPQLAVAPFNSEEAKRHQKAWADYLGVPVEYTNSIGMKLILIPPGTFMMGSEEFPENERSAYKVSLTKPFYIGAHEVTQEQFQLLMGANPSQFNGSNYPVEMVTWDEAVAFCNRLTESGEEKDAGRVYRLPTEAEWEYACRGGTTTKFSFGEDGRNLGQYAWMLHNSNQEPHPVGSKLSNPFSLYDMHGNVWEWCNDWHGNYTPDSFTDPAGPASGRFHVYRGGCWRSVDGVCESGFRRLVAPSRDGMNIGFRVLTTLQISQGTKTR